VRLRHADDGDLLRAAAIRDEQALREF